MQIDPFGIYGFQIGVIMIAIMITISGIVLGMGYALDDRKIKEFGRSEIYQSVISGVLLGSFLLLFANGGVVSSLVNAVTLSNGTSFSCQAMMQSNAALCFASSYLNGPRQYTFMNRNYDSLMTISAGFLASLVALNSILGIMAGVKINLLIVSLSFAGLLQPFLNEIQYAVSALVAIMVGISIESSLLAFVALTATTLVLPTGLLLRTFYPTRKLGGFFIALAIGMYVVFPLSYLFDAMMVSQYDIGSNQTNLSQITFSAQSIKDQYINTIGTNTNQSTGVINSLTNSVSALSLSISNILSSLFNTISELMVQVFVLPVFNLIVTGISIRELSGIFGSEAYFGKFRIL